MAKNKKQTMEEELNGTNETNRDSKMLTSNGENDKNSTSSSLAKKLQSDRATKLRETQSMLSLEDSNSVTSSLYKQSTASSVNWTDSDSSSIDPVERATELSNRLNRASSILVDSLFEFVESVKSETMAPHGEDQNIKRKDKLPGYQQSRMGKKKKKRGLTLPAYAIGWLSSRLNPTAEEADLFHNDGHSQFFKPLSVKTSERLALLRFLLPKYTECLRITRDEWPPPPSNTTPNGTISNIESKQNSSFGWFRRTAPPTSNSAVTSPTRNSYSVLQTARDVDTAKSFLTYFEKWQARPRVDVALFANARMLIADGVPPSWIINMAVLQENLSLLRVERGYMHNLPAFLFSSDETTAHDNSDEGGDEMNSITSNTGKENPNKDAPIFVGNPTAPKRIIVFDSFDEEASYGSFRLPPLSETDPDSVANVESLGQGSDEVDEITKLDPSKLQQTYKSLLHLKISHCSLGEMSGLVEKQTISQSDGHNSGLLMNSHGVNSTTTISTFNLRSADDISLETRDDESLSFYIDEYGRPRRRRRRSGEKIGLRALIKRMPNLESISLSHNELFRTSTVLAGLRSLPNLKALDLSYNRLFHMENAFLMIGNIKILRLSGNQLTSTRGIDRLYSLEQLALDKNLIADIPSIAGLANLPILSAIHLSGNPLQTVSSTDDYRIRILDLFRESRCSRFPRSATYRDMLGALPILDGKATTKEELLSLKNLTFVPSVAVTNDIPAKMTTESSAKSSEGNEQETNDNGSTPVSGYNGNEEVVTTTIVDEEIPTSVLNPNTVTKRKVTRRKPTRTAKIQNKTQTLSSIHPKRWSKPVQSKILIKTNFKQTNDMDGDSANKSFCTIGLKLSVSTPLISSLGEEYNSEYQHVPSSKEFFNVIEALSKVDPPTEPTTKEEHNAESEKREKDAGSMQDESSNIQATSNGAMAHPASTWGAIFMVIPKKGVEEKHEGESTLSHAEDVRNDLDKTVDDAEAEIEEPPEIIENGVLSSAGSVGDDVSEALNGTDLCSLSELPDKKKNSLAFHNGATADHWEDRIISDETHNSGLTYKSQLSDWNIADADSTDMDLFVEKEKASSEKSTVDSIFPNDDDESIFDGVANNGNSDARPKEEFNFGIAEKASVYDGPEEYAELFVTEFLEYYFRRFVFRQNVQDDDDIVFQTDKDNSYEQLPRIQLYKSDREIMLLNLPKSFGRPLGKNSAMTYEVPESVAEKMEAVWREEVLACGVAATSRLMPDRSILRGFHGDTIRGRGGDVYMSESRKVLLCLSDAAVYIIPDLAPIAHTNEGEELERRFPSPMPLSARFNDAYWPHAAARHPLKYLKRITIGFQFQRLILHFILPDLNSQIQVLPEGESGAVDEVRSEFTYIISTCNKLRTVELLQNLQRQIRGQSNASTLDIVPIDNDDRIVLDAFAAAIAPESVGVVFHYQILRQRWKRGERSAVRRVCIVTDAKVFLLDENYSGDGSDPAISGIGRCGDVKLSVVDSAELSRIMEVLAADEDPQSITLVIKAANRLMRPHRWRLSCRNRENAERLVDDVRKAMISIQQ